VNIGDRVLFIERTALYRGWPYNKTGTVIAQPYTGVWYVRVDRYPDSRVAVTAQQVKVLQG
jgi:hypothetical protein